MFVPAQRVMWKRIVLWAVPALLLAGLLVSAFLPKPVPVDLAVVARGPLVVTVGGEGQTRVRDLYTVSAPLAAQVERLALEPGDPVTAGETVVALLRPVDPAFLDRRSRTQGAAEVEAAQSAVTAADRQVARAAAQLAFSRSELERAVSLAAQGNVARRTVEQARMDLAAHKAEFEADQATLDARRHDLAAARARLIEPEAAAAAGGAGPCCVTVRAPAGGRVLHVLQKSAAVVAPGTPLLEIGDPAALEVVVDLLSADAVKVAARSVASIEDWGGGPALPAIVRRVEPSGFTKVSALGIEEQRVNVIIDLAGAAPPALGDGFRVMARVEVWRAGDTVRAPLGALFRDGADWAAFRVEDGIARLRRLRLGQMNDQAAQVLDGLAAGDRLVLHPSDRVADGVTVVAR